VYRPPRRQLVPLLILVGALLTTPATASAQVKRERRNPSTTPSGLLIVTPGRIEDDVVPGQRTTSQVEVFNDSDKAVDISVGTTDLGPASDPHSVADETENGEFGAGDWLTSEITDDTLQPFEAVKFNVVIDPPTTAPVGTNLGGLVVHGAAAKGAPGTADNPGSVRVDGLLQVFLTVPGPVKHDISVDYVKVRDKILIGSTRVAVWDITFRNRGTVNEHLSGTTTVQSIFGNSAYRANLDKLLVLRGSQRTTRVVWNGLPWIGAFHPEVRVRGDDAKLITATGQRVVVFPWWIVVVIAALIVLPSLFLWWRRRQDWKLYMDEQDWDADDEGAYPSERA
jgi:hypothetical protein